MHRRYQFRARAPVTLRRTIRFGSVLINTVVTCNTDTADDWVQTVRASSPDGNLIVGLDCEWRPNYTRWTTNPVAILQLCAGTNCLILQLFYVDEVPDSIEGLLGDTGVRLVGIGIGQDAAKLAEDYGLVCARPVDVEDLCNEYLGLVGRKLGLKGYAREVLGLTMEKPRRITMSNWEARGLSEAQIEYACIDAYVSYRLGLQVLDRD